MAINVTAVWDSFAALLSKISSYQEAVALMAWDLRTGAPRKGAAPRSETIGLLSTEAFKLQTSAEMGGYLSQLLEEDAFKQLSDTQQRIVKDAKEEYDRSVKIPEEKYKEYVELTANTETLWEDFKESGDFAGFEPYLTKIVAKLQEFIDYWGVKDTRYDTLLHMYEPGLTVEKVDQVFGQLRDRLVPVVTAISEHGHKPDTAFLHNIFPKEQQEKVSLFLLEQIGYDFEAGRVDESMHPFQTTINHGDARITTHYIEDDVVDALFSSLHEGGHALYEQNVSAELARTPLAQGTSMGIHESQSRFWENIIGRSRPFWERYYGDLQKHFPEQLNEVPLDQFFKAINAVKNSLIRIQSDELTYNLHIIIRYEIEKMIFNEGLPVSELPRVWNEKYQSYLGLTPPNDGVGVLQDVHWSAGLFGYFPSYALGNMYSAQFANTMMKELPEFDKWVGEGNFAPIREWLIDKIYKYGKSRTPSELIEGVTGEPLNPTYLADYLEQKYKEIYGL